MCAHRAPVWLQWSEYPDLGPVWCHNTGHCQWPRTGHAGPWAPGLGRGEESPGHRYIDSVHRLNTHSLSFSFSFVHLFRNVSLLRRLELGIYCNSPSSCHRSIHWWVPLHMSSVVVNLVSSAGLGRYARSLFHLNYRSINDNTDRQTLHWQTVVIILTWKIVQNQINVSS